MQLGMVGLGRMGANMVRRLLKGGHQRVVFSRSPQAVTDLVNESTVGSTSLADLTKKLRTPRVVWLMVPAAVVDQTIGDLFPHLEPGDVLIDGGNSYYIDDIRRAKQLASAGVHYVDVGTSGGIWGLERGYCMMIGGDEQTPLREPEHYQYDLNLPDIAEVWRRGSVIASWLLHLTASALIKDPSLTKFAGRVSDSGEGRWTIKAAIDEAVPVYVLTAALYERFSSRGEADFADKLLSAMRYEFGGHVEKN
jgi:6-phosphogluconate dehydrogenase